MSQQDSQAADAPPRSASPSNSFYALSDDEEGEYNTITHAETGKGVKLLFSKSKVRGPAMSCCAHPNTETNTDHDRFTSIRLHPQRITSPATSLFFNSEAITATSAPPRLPPTNRIPSPRPTSSSPGYRNRRSAIRLASTSRSICATATRPPSSRTLCLLLRPSQATSGPLADTPLRFP